MRVVLVFLLLAGLAGPVSAAGVSKTVAQYARDMEEYYKNGKSEILPGLLRVFETQGVLADGEKRLVTAAFLAEVLRRDPTARGRLLTGAGNFGDNARKTLAWAAHLACLADRDTLLASFIRPGEDILARQIKASPAPLEKWDIYSEPSVLRMYWAAFLASGDARPLDAIIGAALRYADLNAAGLSGDACFAVAAAAAALLYEQAPHHRLVRVRLREELGKEPQNSPKAGTLRGILRDQSKL